MCMTQVSIQRKKTTICSHTMCISVTQGCSPMLGTIRTFLYNSGLLRSWSHHLVATSLVTMLSSLPVPALQAGVFSEDEIAKAVLSDPIVPSDAKGLATSFVEQTLPKLLANDLRLIRQFGFSESLDDT